MILPHPREFLANQADPDYQRRKDERRRLAAERKQREADGSSLADPEVEAIASVSEGDGSGSGSGSAKAGGPARHVQVIKFSGRS